MENNRLAEYVLFRNPTRTLIEFVWHWLWGFARQHNLGTVRRLRDNLMNRNTVALGNRNAILGSPQDEDACAPFQITAAS